MVANRLKIPHTFVIHTYTKPPFFHPGRLLGTPRLLGSLEHGVNFLYINALMFVFLAIRCTIKVKLRIISFFEIQKSNFGKASCLKL